MQFFYGKTLTQIALGIYQVGQILEVTTLSLNLTGDEPDGEHDLLSHDGGKGQVVLFVLLPTLISGCFVQLH